MPVIDGSTTASTAAAVTAASIALPPSCSTLRPAADASGWLVAIMPLSDGPAQKRAREALEQTRQRLTVQRERADVRRPREFITPRHRRYPDLTYRRVRRHDEFRIARLLEL